ncbi:MAG: flagellar hook-length control protein FliK [Nitrospiraceae bacterium]|nr:flagellar hook-length control protein FliK [Nitrospiraceae bacterium]
MIYFKVTPTPVDSSLTLAKPSGKELSFKVGDIVKAEVMNILPNAAVLRIKGEVVTAKTETPLTQEGAAYFKVVASSKGNEFKLQFMGYADEMPAGQTAQPQAFKQEAVTQLMRDMAQSLAKPGSAGIQPQTVQDILKSLPSDMSLLPKDIKNQLQALLQTGLKVTGQTIQSRVGALLEQLPPEVTQNVKADMLVSIDKLVNSQLKSAIQDTGVAFEAKMKSLADLAKLIEYASQGSDRSKTIMREPDGTKIFTQADPQQAQKQAAAGEGVKILLQGDSHAVKGDLKATLLQLQQVVAEKLDQADTLTSQQTQTLKNASSQIDGLLKDVESFQLLSKVTDSFYTFLPVSWSELKDAEVIFKRGKSDAKGLSYSCTLNLDLDSFGKVSVMMFMYNRDFFVSFKTQNPEFQKLLSSAVDDLKTAFEEKGLSLKGVNFIERDAAFPDEMESENGFTKSINIKA